jgi:nucleotide-binding universal stress UspA family protein
MTASAPVPGTAPEESVLFNRILVGIDETSESLIAAVQARAVCAPSGHLALLAVAETYLAAQAGMSAPIAGDHVRERAQASLERARELVEPDESSLVAGRMAALLHTECDRSGATLVVVGARPHRRLLASSLGGHDAEALHAVPCSLLIARPGWGPLKPRRVIVAVDSSPDGRLAEVEGRSVARRLGCEVVPVVGLGDNSVDLDLLRAEREDGLFDLRDLAHAVVAASSEDALVVVGRRQARDHRFGGSVAERILHATHCSVLVVRDPLDAASSR